jgi:hypothetical protein
MTSGATATLQLDRDRVRSPEGLAPCRHSLRLVPFFSPSPLLPPSSSGCAQRVLILGTVLTFGSDEGLASDQKAL